MHAVSGIDFRVDLGIFSNSISTGILLLPSSVQCSYWCNVYFDMGMICIRLVQCSYSDNLFPTFVLL